MASSQILKNANGNVVRLENPDTNTSNKTIDVSKLGETLDINGLTAKVIAIDTDNMILQETGGILKKLSVLNLKTTLKTYFDGIYSAFGIGQSWQDVTSSRSAGVTYTNNTGKPIFISIEAHTLGETEITRLKVGLYYVAKLEEDSNVGGQIKGNLQAVIPSGSTYLFEQTHTGLDAWFELRD